MEAGVEEAGVVVSSSSPPCTPPGPQRLDTPQEEQEVDITVPDSQPGPLLVRTSPTSCRRWPRTEDKGRDTVVEEASGLEEGSVVGGEGEDEEEVVVPAVLTT